MSVDELAEIIERLQDADQGSSTIMIPCPTGGYFTPSDSSSDDDTVYIE